MDKSSTSPKPARMSGLSPHLVCANAPAAIEFYKRAFDAEQMFRLDGPDGRLMHASLCIFGASVMMAEERPDCGARSPKSLGGTPVTLHLYVKDAAAVAARAVAAGATEIMPVTDMFWGDRYGVIEDPFGHRWSIATHTRDLTEAEIRKAAAAAIPG